MTEVIFAQSLGSPNQRNRIDGIARTPSVPHSCEQMKIASAPLNQIPAYVPKPAEPAAVQKVTLPLGGTFHFVSNLGSVAPFSTPASQFDRKKVTELVLRYVSNRVADHLGQKAVIAKDVIWLCFDLKTLHDKAKGAGWNTGENLGLAMNFAGNFCGALADVPQLEAAAAVGTGFYFLAEIGGKAYQGAGNFSLDEIMQFVPLKPEDRAVEELRSTVSGVLEELQKV